SDLPGSGGPVLLAVLLGEWTAVAPAVNSWAIAVLLWERHVSPRYRPTDPIPLPFAAGAHRLIGSPPPSATSSVRVRGSRSGPYACPAPERHPAQPLPPIRGRRSCAMPAKTPWTGAHPPGVRNPAAICAPWVSLLPLNPQGSAVRDAKGTRHAKKSSSPGNHN